jgi:DNA-binding CsgD family transcriptional regulator
MSSAPKRNTLMPIMMAPGLKESDLRFFAVNLPSFRDANRAGTSGHADGTLTAREREVLAMIGKGFSNKLVARTLEISPETVKSHVKHIFLKLEVSTRTQAVFLALSLELL